MIETLMAGGPVMVPIGLCSVVALAVFIERLWSLRRDAVVPSTLTQELVKLARQAAFEQGTQLAKQHDIAVGRVAAVAFTAAGNSRSVVKERLEEVGRREAAELERGIPIVGTIASIAPLLGLLGTVGGMIRTFAVIQTSGLGNVADLAGGISEALITTFAGLCVGIPAVVANRYLLSRVDNNLVDLEQTALELTDAVAFDTGVAGESA